MSLQKQMVELSTDECLQLLGNHNVGRLAHMDTKSELPMIMPVNYALHENRIVFRTGADSNLGSALFREPVPVAFEVDGVDQVDRTGWSVVVRGHANLITNSFDLAALWDLPLQPWPPGPKPYFVRIQPSQISGRRIRRPHVPTLANYWWG